MKPSQSSQVSNAENELEPDMKSDSDNDSEEANESEGNVDSEEENESEVNMDSEEANESEGNVDAEEENESEINMNSDEANDSEGNIDSEVEEIESDIKRVKRRKPGIIYLSKIPTTMNVLKIREYFSKFGQLGNVYLQQDTDHSKKANKATKTKVKKLKFSEGWIEFKSKRKAKYVHTFVNNQPVGGKKSNPDYETLWNIKYLPRFKWAFLRQRLEFERQIHRQRMSAEIQQVKKETDHYIHTTNKKANAKQKDYVFKQKLTEDEILKKKANKKLKDEKYRQKLKNKKIKKKQNKKHEEPVEDDFLTSVFVGGE